MIMLLKYQNEIFKKCSIMNDDIMSDTTMPQLSLQMYILLLLINVKF